MKVHLMFPDSDFDPTAEPPPYIDDLMQDLQLQPVLNAMGGGDTFVQAMCRAGLISGGASAGQVAYRHQVLEDCAQNRATITALYQMATGVLEDRQRIHRANFSFHPESVLRMSVSVLEACLPYLHRLRDVADTAGPSFSSDGFQTFFSVLRRELDDAYLAAIEPELRALRFRDGLLLSAELGEGNTGVDFVLRTPDATKRTFFHRTPLRKPTRSVTIPERDDASFNALSSLRGDAVAAAAKAASGSVSHVIDFFTVLRQELAFYLGCLNLADALNRLGHQMCIPHVGDIGSSRHCAKGIYDAGLALDNGIHATPSDYDSQQCPITIITGANRGGKSTFLRGLGIAAMLAASGAYAPASVYELPLYRTILTHFRREEDENLMSGKFDEELTRMAAAADQLHDGSLLLSNESFSSTNEREGSQIAEDVLRGLVDADVHVHVVMVTHLFELAEKLRQGSENVAFLRAERRDDGARTFRILPGFPEATSHAMDLYQRIFEPRTSGSGADETLPEVVPS